MTEKRTMPESHEERVRELAELQVDTGQVLLSYPPRVLRAPDPRFDALRGAHHLEWTLNGDVECVRCWASEEIPDGVEPLHYSVGFLDSYCLRTDLGAIVLAFGAMDTPVTFACDDDEVWSAVPVQKQRNGGGIPFITNGPSPEDAGSAALWQLVFGA